MALRLAPPAGVAGQLLEAARCGIEALRHLVLLDAQASARLALVAEAADVVAQPVDLAARLDQAVGHDQPGHHQEPDVADIADRLPDAADLLVEHQRERGEMLLLAIIALHGVGPSIDLNDHLGHPAPSRSYSPRTRRIRAIA